jgi:hypothetical protein
VRYPTITVPKAHELIVQHHARIRHQTDAEQDSARDTAQALRHRMLLIVTVPPHDDEERTVFNLQLDADQLHPLRRERLLEADRYTAATRTKVHEALESSGTGLSGNMLLHGLGSLALHVMAPKYNVLGPSYNRRVAMRHLLQAENDAAVREYLAVTSEMYSGQIGGHNPDTGDIWRGEENTAHNAWQAAQRIAELQRRYRTGEPLQDPPSSREAA